MIMKYFKKLVGERIYLSPRMQKMWNNLQNG